MFIENFLNPIRCWSCGKRVSLAMILLTSKDQNKSKRHSVSQSREEKRNRVYFSNFLQHPFSPLRSMCLSVSRLWATWALVSSCWSPLMWCLSSTVFSRVLRANYWVTAPAELNLAPTPPPVRHWPIPGSLVGSRPPPGWWEALEVSKPASQPDRCLSFHDTLFFSLGCFTDVSHVLCATFRGWRWVWLRDQRSILTGSGLVLQLREAGEDQFPDSSLPSAYALSPSHLF